MAFLENASPSPIGVPRRAALVLGLTAAAGLTGVDARAESAAGGIKLTVLYGAPKDPAEFEKYYLEKHMPIASAVKDIKRVELARGLPGPDGKPPSFYRITELWFDSPELFQQVTATPQWKAVIADVPNFASGGATVLVSKID
jgi:uncharacterized protein (TIGR02118 family)